MRGLPRAKEGSSGMSDVDHADNMPTWMFVLPWGLRTGAGVDQVVINLIRCAADTGIRPILLVNDWNSPRPSVQVIDGLRTVRMRLVAPSTSFKMLLRVPFQLFRLWIVLRKERVSVVNVHYVGLTAWIFQALRTLGLYRGRLALSWHGADLEAARASFAEVHKQFARLTACVDVNIACSKSLAAKIREAFPGAARLTPIPNGIDLMKMSMFASAPGSDAAIRAPSRPYVISIAAFQDHKGHDVLLAAFEKIALEFPDVDLLLIGGTGRAWISIERAIQSSPIAHRVSVLRDLPHAEAMTCLSRATVLVLASRREPFGLVLLEAGFFGVAVIGSDVDGIPETIENGVCGELFPVGSVDALSDSLRRLLGDVPYRMRLGERLRLNVLSSGDWQARFDAYRTAIASDG